MNTVSYESNPSLMKIILEPAKRSHYIILISLGIIIALCIIIAIEFGISMVSHIPYAGPLLIILLTIPLFLVNFFILITTLAAFALFPPMVSEKKTLIVIAKEFINLVKSKGLHILIYLSIFIIFLYLFMKILYFITGYSAGITKALQWKINLTYPNLINNFTLNSFLTDIIQEAAPQPDPAHIFKRYGFSLFNFLDAAKYLTGISYYIAFSLVFSFPISLFFIVLSNFYRKIKL